MLSSHTVNIRPIYEVSVSGKWGSCEGCSVSENESEHAALTPLFEA